MSIYSVYVTTNDIEEARGISRAIVEERLAACANVFGEIQSYYWWDGRVNTDFESAVMAKTHEAKLQQLIERIRELHEAETPCITAWHIDKGSGDYLQWIYDETTGAD